MFRVFKSVLLDFEVCLELFRVFLSEFDVCLGCLRVIC